jgi:hypothetical protein
MKQVLLLGLISIVALTMHAQDSWTIKLNNKTIITAKAEDEDANVKTIMRSELSKPGSLQVLYKQAQPKPGWRRSILLFDENDVELSRIDSLTAKSKISSATLKKGFADKKEIRIYTISLPTDPNLAAAIRVRRVHLGTLKLRNN